MQLKLTIDQVNIVLQSLGQAPYIQVEGVIREIRSQVQPQLNLNGAGPVEEEEGEIEATEQ
jgi:hypothetical protein